MPILTESPVQIQSYTPPTTTPASLIFSATDWTILTFLLSTTGTVVIGTNDSLSTTVFSGSVALPTDVPVSILVGPGTRVYTLGEANQSLGVFVQRIGEVIGQALDYLFTIAKALTPRDPTLEENRPWFEQNEGYKNWRKGGY